MAKKLIFNIVMYFLLFTFLLGIYFCIYGDTYKFDIRGIEGFENGGSTPPKDVSNNVGIGGCSDLLVKSGDKIILYNTKVSGSSPIAFNNLDEYTAYLEKQRENGLRCPVLFLQEENNAQGETVYRIRPNLDGTENGLPTSTTFIPGSVLMQQPLVGPNGQRAVTPLIDATLDNPPYNNNMYLPFDPYGQHIGRFTPMDQINISTEQQYISDNAMDSNWGGPEYTKNMVASGKYADNEVYRPNLNTP